MPVVYAPPEPFAPGISSAYGAAQQWSQDAPAIIRAAGDANSLQAASADRADRLRFAYAQANAEAQDRQADRYFRSDAANADREQSALNLGATLSQRNEEAGTEMDARARLQAQATGNAAWLNQQDLNQKEQMRLQQMKAAVADVQASNLTPQQKQDYITQLRTGIDPLEQRLKASQERMIQQHGRLYEAQLAMRAQETETMAKVNNMTAGQRIHYEVPPQAAEQIEAAVNQQNLTPQERDAAVQRLKRLHPGAQQFVIDPDGKLTPVKREAPDHPKFAELESMAEIEARAEHPPVAEKDEMGKPVGKAVDTPEFYKKKLEVLNRLRGQEPPPPPAPNEYQKKLIEENKPFTIGEGTKEQNEVVKALGDFRANIARVPGVDVKMFQDQATTAMKLYSTYGNVLAMPPREKELFLAIQKSLERVAPRIEAASEPKPTTLREKMGNEAVEAVRTLPAGIRSSNPFNRGFLGRLNPFN